MSHMYWQGMETLRIAVVARCGRSSTSNSAVLVGGSPVRRFEPSKTMSTVLSRVGLHLALTAGSAGLGLLLGRFYASSRSVADHGNAPTKLVEVQVSERCDSFVVFVVNINSSQRMLTTIEAIRFASKRLFQNVKVGTTYLVPEDFADRSSLTLEKLNNPTSTEANSVTAAAALLTHGGTNESAFRVEVVGVERGFVEVKRLEGKKDETYDFHVDIRGVEGYLPEVNDVLVVTVASFHRQRVVVSYRPLKIWIGASGTYVRTLSRQEGPNGAFLPNDGGEIAIPPHLVPPGRPRSCRNLVEKATVTAVLTTEQGRARTCWRAIALHPAEEGSRRLIIPSGDKHGITVLPRQLHFTVREGGAQVLEVQISNNAFEAQMLVEVAVFDDCRSIRINGNRPVEIPAKESRTVSLTCTAPDEGLQELYCFMLFKFEAGFNIGRVITVNRPPVAVLDIFNTSEGFGYRVRAPLQGVTHRGVVSNADHLNESQFPPEFSKICLGQSSVVEVFPFLAEPLQPSNYELKLRILSYLDDFGERLQSNATGGISSLRGVELQPVDGNAIMSLQLPQKEDWSHVRRTDTVVISQHGLKFGREFEGLVDRIVDSTCLHLRLAGQFRTQYEPGTLVDVTFERCHRVTGEGSRRALQAIRGATYFLPNDLLFPQMVLGDGGRRASNLAFNFFNQALNEGQKAAVRGIVGGEDPSKGSSSPYLIFGPPGTGKTVTLTEAILQVFSRKPRSRILVVAPTNKAADVICESLAGQDIVELESFLTRFEANSRRFCNKQSPKSKYTTVYDCLNRERSAAVRDQLYGSRIIVCTWFMCGTIKKILRHFEFSHLFIDEAAHMTEPRTLVALTAAPRAERVVLAGDPLQLGNVISSQAADEFGLSVSLMERLLRTAPPYKRLPFPGISKLPYDARVIVKLTENYRSHPEIVKLFSNMFYAGDVVSRRSDLDHDDSSAPPPWVDRLPAFLRDSFPVLFHDTKGACSTTIPGETSPFNVTECEEAIRLAGYFCQAGVAPADIAVITPYVNQVRKLREQAAEASTNVRDVVMGTVEEFQGSERSVVIVSLVRSGFENFHGTFAVSPRHINVAISRAKHFLVVVGDGTMMNSDVHWKKFLKMVSQR